MGAGSIFATGVRTLATSLEAVAREFPKDKYVASLSVSLIGSCLTGTTAGLVSALLKKGIFSRRNDLSIGRKLIKENLPVMLAFVTIFNELDTYIGYPITRAINDKIIGDYTLDELEGTTVFLVLFQAITLFVNIWRAGARNEEGELNYFPAPEP